MKNLRLERRISEMLERHAKQSGRSQANIMEAALERYLAPEIEAVEHVPEVGGRTYDVADELAGSARDTFDFLGICLNLTDQQPRLLSKVGAAVACVHRSIVITQIGHRDHPGLERLRTLDR